MARRRTRRRLRKRTRGKPTGLRQPTLKEVIDLAHALKGTAVGKQLIKYVNDRIAGKASSSTSSTFPKLKMKYKRTGISYGGTVNVKSDAERWTKTYYKQKVTKQQQRKINKRFKHDAASLVTYENDYPLTETVPQQLNAAKWMWFCHNTLSWMKYTWDTFSSPDNANVNTGEYNNNPLASLLSQEQAIYYNKFISKYEIFNPTNYDMNVIIYDIVCKEDTTQTTQSGTDPIVASTANLQNADVVQAYSNPLALMYKGLQGAQDPQNNQFVVGRPSTGESIYDITFKPTTSYPFNMYWTIVRKKVVRLQPGASFNHKFTYKCKNLMNRGFYGYKYDSVLNNNRPKDIAVKGFTSGTLFKVWGQISGSTASSQSNDISNPILEQDVPGGVVNLSGRLMIKEWFQAKYYQCNPKFSYRLKQTKSIWRPTDEEELTIPTVIDMQPVEDELPADDTGIND